MIDVETIIGYIEEVAPLALQESYDNAGLIIGDRKMHVKGILLCIDINEEVIEEAVIKECNLIISHHPLIFNGLKKITGQNYVQRCIIKAIKNDIAVYAAHTNMDNVKDGVNGKFAEKLGLKNRKILHPKQDILLKLITFVPHEFVEKVQNALFGAGAGFIGDYDRCSFNSIGTGTFRASENANPFVGKVNEHHSEPETRVEVILPQYLKVSVVQALIKAHPYEEPAFDLIPLRNEWGNVGAGMIGELEHEMDEMNFLNLLKSVFNTQSIRYTQLLNRKVKKIAFCGGSGSEFLKDAISAKADVFVSGDFKYHQFFDADHNILIVDIGHFESEQYTKDVFYEIITKKIPNFAVRISEVNTNPIKYL